MARRQVASPEIVAANDRISDATLAGYLRGCAATIRRLGTEVGATALEAAAGDVATGGPTARLLRPHAGEDLGTGLALRLLGALHRLALTGAAPDLAALFPSTGGDPERGDLKAVVVETVVAHADVLARLLTRQVQTNEVGRCATLVGGFTTIAAATALPLRLFELGASAGLCLRWDRYFYRLGTVSLGDPTAAVRFEDFCVPGAVPDLSVPVTIADRRCCDRSPLDPADPDDRLTLLSFVWPDQSERIYRLKAALDVAAVHPVPVERASAGDWLSAVLDDRLDGVTTVVYHSIVRRYISDAEWARILGALHSAGAAASPSAPLAWLRFEGASPLLELYELRLTMWPGGDERLLATSEPHGPPVRWLA
jgi:hypothetical protein